MRAAISKSTLEAQIVTRFGDVVRLREKRFAQFLSTGVPEIDSLTGGGFPRGAITEIFGSLSSGRTSLMQAVLAHATAREEACALVDTDDAFDPMSAAGPRMDFDRLLWIRCAGSVQRSFKALDLLLQSGGFGLVVLDIADVPAATARKIISSWWFRFRRAIEDTPTVLVVISQVSCVRSCASLILRTKSTGEVWFSMAGRAFENSRLPLKTDSAHLQERTDRRLARLALVTGGSLSPAIHGSVPTYSLLLGGAELQAERQKPTLFAENSTEFRALVG